MTTALNALAGATIILDLDGTLVDTAPDLVRALNAVVEADGYPATPIEDVRAMVGRGSRALLRRAYARCGTALPEPLMDARQAAFLAIYEAGIADHSRPFPGVEAALDAFMAAGAICVIATNKPQHLTERLIDTLGWRRRFARLVGADAASRKKPHAAHLIEAAGGRDAISRAVMIGDSATDVAAARAAGTPVALMRHGYTERPVETLGADRILEAWEEAPPAVAALLETI